MGGLYYTKMDTPTPDTTRNTAPDMADSRFANSEHLQPSDATLSQASDPERIPWSAIHKIDSRCIAYLTSQLTEARKERDDYASRFAELVQKYDDQALELAALKSERDNWRVSSVCRELSKDKERLDWLEQKEVRVQTACAGSIVFEHSPIIDPHGPLRDAIDSAREDSK